MNNNDKEKFNKMDKESNYETGSQGKREKFNPKKNKKGRKGGSQVVKYNRGKMFNDISFYTKNKTITDDFGKVPFNFILGNKIPGVSANKVYLGYIFSYIVTSLFQSRSTNVGTSDTHGTPSILDQVTTIVYTAMRRANSGAKNDIEPLDVIISNLLASIDIYANAIYATRVFRIANTFSWKNRKIPFDLFRHMNLDYADFVAHQADYRGRYNTIVAQAKTIRTLANFPFLNAYFSEFKELFKDEDTDTGREQLIFSVKGFHHIYDPRGVGGLPGGMVRYMDKRDFTGVATDAGKTIYTGMQSNTAGNTRMKFGYLLDIMQKQIDALITDSDFNLIQADIEKAFGENSGYYELDVISDDNSITPVYSGEFMAMFHNGTFQQSPFSVVSVATGGTPDIDSTSGFTYCPKNWYVNTIYQLGDSTSSAGQHTCGYECHFPGHVTPTICNVVDTNIDNPSPEDIIIMTRFKTLCTVRDTSVIPEDLRPDSSPAIPTGFALVGPQHAPNFLCFVNGISSYAIDMNGVETITHEFRWNNIQPVSFRESSTAYLMGVVFGFNHYPIFWLGMSDTTGNFTGVPAFEVNNLKGLSNDELDSINLGCFLSLWDLPSRTNL